MWSYNVKALPKDRWRSTLYGEGVFSLKMKAQISLQKTLSHQ